MSTTNRSLRRRTVRTTAAFSGLLAALLGLPAISVGAQASAATLVQVPAIELANVAAHASSLVPSAQAAAVAQDQASVSVSEVSLTGATVNDLAGTVTTADGTSLPFSLSGTLFSDPSGSMIDGTLVDQTGTFSVLRFQIVNNPSIGIFYTDSAKSSTSPYLALYLERAGTRDVTFIECPAATLFGTSMLADLETDSTSFAPAPHADIFWIESMFVPDGVIHKELTGPIAPGTVYNPTVNGGAPSVVRPLTVAGTKYNYPFYSDYYEFNNAYITDSIELEEYVQYPTNTNSPIVADFFPDYTDFSNSNGLNVWYTDWQVGGNGALGIKLTCPNGGSQRVQIEQSGGQLERSSSWTISWGYSLAWAGLGATLNYNDGGSYQLNSGTLQDLPLPYVGDMYAPSGSYMSYAGPSNGNTSGHDSFLVTI